MASRSALILFGFAGAVFFSPSMPVRGQEIFGTKQGKVYHTHPTECGSAKNILAENRIRYPSADAAERAGRRLCKHCANLDRLAEERDAEKRSENPPEDDRADTQEQRQASRSGADRPAEPTEERGRVLKVLAGGTLVLEGGDKAALIGVLCPSRGQLKWKEAIRFLSERTKGQSIRMTGDASRCRSEPRDRLGRRWVYAAGDSDGHDLGGELLARGLGWVDRGPHFEQRPDYLAKEEEAWRGGRGIWKRLSGSTGGREVVTGRHARTYHRPDCRHVEHLTKVMKMSLNEATGRRLFPCADFRVAPKKE